MGKPLNIVFLLLWCFFANLSSASERIKIIPEPVSAEDLPGEVILDRSVVLSFDRSDRELTGVVNWFRAGLSEPAIKENGRTGVVFNITLNQHYDRVIGEEGYRLSVTREGIITLVANSCRGIFYGMQTLLQLPFSVNARTGEEKGNVPCCRIVDYPRFGYRGLMLDVSRHFFSREEIKRYIDEMVMYKYNVFHWHLTDDQGWRIEIKSLPELTRTGARRVPRTGPWGSFKPAEPGEKATDGGYYTQDDIREIVEYARERYVTVLPEIDVPGHSLALIASFPGLSCTRLKYNVSPGTDIYKKDDNALCVGNDSVYTVLDKIFGEVASLFPCEYIHIGGDEAYKGFWEKCEACCKVMAREKLKNSTGLQSYFIAKVEEIISSKGKKMIGWDEILEGGRRSHDVVIMSRYGADGTKDAVRKRHKVIVTPWGYAYWDLYQGDPAIEPLTYGSGRLSATYNYDILPDSVDQRMIAGGQGCLWTEFVPTFRHAEYMTWPRSFALAEILWSPKEKRNWNSFIERMEKQFERFDLAGVNYSRAVYDPYVIISKDSSGVVKVRLACEIKESEIYYTLDETNPDKFALRYDGRYLSFPKGAAQLKAATYRRGKQSGRQLNVKLADLYKRVQ